MSKTKKNTTPTVTVPYSPLPTGLLDDIDFHHIHHLEEKAFNLEQVVLEQAMLINELKMKIKELQTEMKFRKIYAKHNVNYDKSSSEEVEF